MSKSMIRICGTLFTIGLTGMIIAGSMVEDYHIEKILNNVFFGVCMLSIIIGIWNIK